MHLGNIKIMIDHEANIELGERMRALRERRPGAVEDLVEEFTEPLLAAALGFGWTEPDAEELVQDTLVAFMEKVESFEMRSSLKTYLFGILYNKARELRRHRSRVEGSDDIERVFDERFNRLGIWSRLPRGPEEEAAAKELRRWIENCSEGLSDDQRAAFYLKEVDGQTSGQICDALGVSGTNLGVLLFRARNKLRECLERKWKGQ
jgi:RNA polymerase sigma-70 factor, ECF subfamily